MAAQCSSYSLRILEVEFRGPHVGELLTRSGIFVVSPTSSLSPVLLVILGLIPVFGFLLLISFLLRSLVAVAWSNEAYILIFFSNADCSPFLLPLYFGVFRMSVLANGAASPFGAVGHLVPLCSPAAVNNFRLRHC